MKTMPNSIVTIVLVEFYLKRNSKIKSAFFDLTIPLWAYI